METKQTSQMVSWLDEERRKDKALITKLEERAAAQATLLEDQARRIQSLEGDLAAMQANTISVTMFDEMISRVRIELTTALEQFDARRASSDQDMKKLRDMDREAMNKALDEMREETLARIERELQPRKAEEERLSRIAVELQSYADNLSKGFEEFERTLSFLEEQRRQDTRRLSDANSELNEMNKRIEGQQAKLELLEDLSRRNERTVEEVTKTLADFKQQRQEWLEQEALAAQERERATGDLLRRIDAFGEDMTAFAKQFENWADTYRAMKKHVEDFDRLADRVDRRLNEVTEVQRLSEDRFRQEWEEFLQDDQKRWRQFTLTNEEAWRANEKLTGEIQGQLAQLNEHRERLAHNIKVLTTTHQETLQALMSYSQTAREQLDEGIKK
jgi:chromosome segregation ATPase